MKQSYVVVFEQTPNNYCRLRPRFTRLRLRAHKTWDGIQAMIKEAIEFHIEGLQLDGDPVPPPQMSVDEALAYHRFPPERLRWVLPRARRLGG